MVKAHRVLDAAARAVTAGPTILLSLLAAVTLAAATASVLGFFKARLPSP